MKSFCVYAYPLCLLIRSNRTDCRRSRPPAGFKKAMFNASFIAADHVG